MNRKTIDFFVKFAEVCFKRYKNKVKYWMTFNEINNQMNFKNDIFGWTNSGAHFGNYDNPEEAQHFQTIINYPLPGSSFAGRSNLCRYNIAFSVLRLLLETASRKQLPIEIMRTYFRVSPLQHKGFFLPISRLPLIPSFISPFGVFCHSLLHLTPSRLDR